MMSRDDVLMEPVARRIEVFTGAGRRPRGRPEIKARIVAESYARLVGDVADQYGLAKTQLLSWRREAEPPREGRLEPAFTPVVLEQPVVPAGKTPSPHKLRFAGRGGIELEIDGVVMRVDRAAQGVFRWPRIQDGAMRLSASQLSPAGRHGLDAGLQRGPHASSDRGQLSLWRVTQDARGGASKRRRLELIRLCPAWQELSRTMSRR